MKNIRYADMESIYNASRKIATLADDFKMRYVKMYEVVDELGEHWQGIDADSFYERIGSVRTKYEQMYSVMMQYSEFILSVAQRYEMQSNEITEAISSLDFD